MLKKVTCAIALLLSGLEAVFLRPVFLMIAQLPLGRPLGMISDVFLELNLNLITKKAV